MNADFIWDDAPYIRNESLMDGMDGLARIWFSPRELPGGLYWPLTATSFWVEHLFWGSDPLGYHLVNIILHGINSLLVWALLQRLQVPGAWIAAVVFSLHPVHVESVAWVVERKDLLSSFFYLLAMLFYLKEYERVPLPRYLLCLVLYTGCLLSKTMNVTFPAAVLLLLWWKKERLIPADGLRLVPFFLIGLLMTVLTAVWHEQEVASSLDLSLPARVLIAGRALCTYAWITFLPVRLAPVPEFWHIDPTSPAQYLYPVAILALMATAWYMRGRWGKAPLVAVLYFLVTLSPALGFVDFPLMTYTYTGSRFLYLACLAPIGLTAGWVAGSGWNRSAGVVAAAGVMVALGVLTWIESRNYRDQETFYRHMIARNPEAWYGHGGLGMVLRLRGDLDQAIHHLKEAIRLQPGYLNAQNSLGNALLDQGHHEEGLEHLELAVRLKPDREEYWISYAVALHRLGHLTSAVEAHREALRLNPRNATTHASLAAVLRKLGRTDDALSEYEEAHRLAPGDANVANSLAWMLAGGDGGGQRNPVRAISLAESAVRSAGGTNPHFLDTLAFAYSADGQYGEALATARRALALSRNEEDAALAQSLERRIGEYAGKANKPEELPESTP